MYSIKIAYRSPETKITGHADIAEALNDGLSFDLGNGTVAVTQGRYFFRLYVDGKRAGDTINGRGNLMGEVIKSINAGNKVVARRYTEQWAPSY